MHFNWSMFTTARRYASLKSTKTIRHLFSRPVLEANRDDELPKTIYAFWHDGIDNAPEICQLCIESWRRLNPSWSVVVLDRDSSQEFLDIRRYSQSISVSHFSDLLRAKILRRNGGVWVDATVLCLKPLDDWLPVIFNQTNFFGFYRPHWSRVISSWFLASTAQSPLISGWDDLSDRYWCQLRTAGPPYFWFHYLFEWMVASGARNWRAWGAVPKISAIPLHIVQRMMKSGDMDETARRIVGSSPMQKLTHKTEASVDDVFSMLSGVIKDELIPVFESFNANRPSRT